MFDNIIGNQRTTSTLKKEIQSHTLPQAILFFGPPYSGKLSTALELARILTCKNKKGEWQCECSSCIMQKQLLHPYTQILGPRYFNIEIAATSDVFRRSRQISTQFLFIRAVRKLARRFDSTIWGGENKNTSNIQSLLVSIEEILEDITPTHSLPQEQKLERIIKELNKLCLKLSGFISPNNIPINHIRNIISWAHLSASDSPKIIIIENVNKMLDSSRNSLLKILEEPPTDVFFILTTTQLSTIIPTIRSRLRKYQFWERDKEQSSEILARIFKEDTSQYIELSNYFLAWKELNPNILEKLSKRFIDMVLGIRKEQHDVSLEINELFSTKSKKEAVQLFLQRIIAYLGSLIQGKADLKESKLNIDIIENWLNIIRSRYNEFITLNLSAPLLIESLFYQMRAVL